MVEWGEGHQRGNIWSQSTLTRELWLRSFINTKMDCLRWDISCVLGASSTGKVSSRMSSTTINFVLSRQEMHSVSTESHILGV